MSASDGSSISCKSSLCHGSISIENRKYEPVPEEIKSRKDAEDTMEFLGGLLKRVREAKKALTNTGPVPTVTEVPNNLYDRHKDGIPQPIMPQQVHNAVALMENVSSLPEQNLEGHGGFPLPDWFQQSFLSQLSQGDAYNIINNMSQYGINPRSNAPYLPNNANADYAQNILPEFQSSSSRNRVVEDVSFQEDDLFVNDAQQIVQGGGK
ncbi:hypothetical protein QJS10_CPA06g00614 [Acorus calamus]|uniref:Uncharacterized protein n=1 Tax=Acorus calamus TaxID=4465 RepID=A0AAV9ENG5_ACOCL|nr:hypothetical protein QJS10_CPA06g00614 [Acorus calamus]